MLNVAAVHPSANAAAVAPLFSWKQVINSSANFPLSSLTIITVTCTCMCLCGGLCFPGRVFDSLCCEVLLRSRGCVGEDWMNESLSQVVRWWRHWSRVSGNQPAGGRRSSLWPLIQFSTEQRGPASLFLSSPPPPEWDHRVLLAKTNLRFSSSVMLRRRFSDPLLLLSKSFLLFSSLNDSKGQILRLFWEGELNIPVEKRFIFVECLNLKLWIFQEGFQ